MKFPCPLYLNISLKCVDLLLMAVYNATNVIGQKLRLVYYCKCISIEMLFYKLYIAHINLKALSIEIKFF